MLLLADFLVNDLECQEGDEMQIVTMVESPLETLSASPSMVEPLYLQARLSLEQVVGPPNGNMHLSPWSSSWFLGCIPHIHQVPRIIR